MSSDQFAALGGRRRPRVGALGVLLSLGLLLGAAGELPAGDAKLKITPSAKNAYAPARVRVDAELIGGADTDPNLICLTEEWTYSVKYETVTNREVNKSIRGHNCDTQTQPAEIVRTFSNEFLFMRIGYYNIRLELRNRSGKVVANATTTVRCLASANPQYSDSSP